MPVPMPSHRLSILAGALALSHALAGCGGGGGGGGDGAQAPVAPVAPAASITSANMDVVARRSYALAFDVYDASFAAADQLKSAQNAPATSATSIALGRLRALVGADARGSGTKSLAVSKAVLSATEPCESGSINLSWNDANGNNDIDAGESGSFVFANCVLGGVRFNGGLGMRLTALNSSSAVDSATAAFTFDALTAVSPGESGSISGDLTLQATITYAGPSFTTVTTVDASISGSRLALVDNGAPRTFDNYAGRLQLDEVARLYTFSVSGTATGAGLPGSVSFSTPVPISGGYGVDPTTGELVVVGADNARLRLTASRNASLTLTLDADGDGTADATRTITYAQFATL